MEQIKKKNLILTLFAVLLATLSAVLFIVFTPSTAKADGEEVKEIVTENELGEKEKPSETKSVDMNGLPVLSQEEFSEKLTCPQVGDCLKDKYLVIRIAHFVNDDFYQVDIEMQNGYISFQGPVGLEDEIDFYFGYVSKSTVALEKNYVIYDNDLCLYFQFSSNSSNEPDYTLNSAYENLYYSDSPLLFDDYVVQSTPEDPTPDNPTPDNPGQGTDNPTPGTGENGNNNPTGATVKKGALGISGGLITVAVAGAVIFLILRRKK